MNGDPSRWYFLFFLNGRTSGQPRPLLPFNIITPKKSQIASYLAEGRLRWNQLVLVFKLCPDRGPITSLIIEEEKTITK